MRKGFFPPTDRALQRITDLYNMTWGVAAGIWHLKCSVDHFIEKYPETKEPDLSNRFIQGSKIHGANLTVSYVKKTWEEQKDDLAWWVLLSLLAIYEDWLKSMGDEYHLDFGLAKNKDKTIKFRKDAKKESDGMKNLFYETYKANNSTFPPANSGWNRVPYGSIGR